MALQTGPWMPGCTYPTPAAPCTSQMDNFGGSQVPSQFSFTQSGSPSNYPWGPGSPLEPQGHSQSQGHVQSQYFGLQSGESAPIQENGFHTYPPTQIAIPDTPIPGFNVLAAPQPEDHRRTVEIHKSRLQKIFEWLHLQIVPSVQELLAVFEEINLITKGIRLCCELLREIDNEASQIYDIAKDLIQRVIDHWNFVYQKACQLGQYLFPQVRQEQTGNETPYYTPPMSPSQMGGQFNWNNAP